jgi:hypothetical protein
LVSVSGVQNGEGAAILKWRPGVPPDWTGQKAASNIESPVKSK